MVESVPVPGVECLDELGRGARTAVYRARRDGREYAVKVLRSVGDQREAVAFRREAALLASLDHPGLARVHDVGEAAGHPYLIMDLVAGRPLAEVLRQEGQLDEARAARIGAEVADALAAAHRAGLVHRDVKPDNIMIGPDGRARVIDFGFAARTGDDVADVAVGTFAYSAPEQTGMLRRAVDGRADLYALGVVLFECLTGTLPFVATETGELIRMHLAVPAPDVQTARPAVSAALAAVLAALLAKDPDDRYQSGAGLRRDLLRVAAGESDAFPLSTGVTRAVDEDDLVGRDDQRARLVGRWQRVGQGRGGGVVLVEGPPGAGKSRLVRELTGTVAASGGLVLYGRCGAGEALPLAPLRAAVDGYVHAVERLDDPARHLAEERLRAATGHAAGNAAGLLTPLSPGLSRLLRSPALPGHDDQRQFVDAVAAFLVALAGGAGGAVLHLDDVQWWDEATRQVVRRLVPLLADSALLVVVTARDDPQLDGFVADVAAGCDLRLALAPLDEAAVGRLVAGRLGPLTVSPALVTRLAARGGGNPLAVGEYIRALIDTGLVRPSWGEWVLDESGLDALALPEDIMTLVLRRVDGLGAQARRMLTVAAVAGRRFSPDLVAAVSGVAADEVERAFVEAATHQLIEPADGGGYVFLHDRIQEALLSDVDDIEQRRLHRRIAEELDRAGTGQVYALARHHLRGEPERAPERAVAAAAAAGALALAEHAPADAVDYLSQAVAVATAAELTLDAGFHVDLGVAASRIGRYALADTHLRQALDVEPDAMRRAAIYGLLAEVHHSQWEGDRAVEMAMRGLAELGRRPPRNPLALAVSTLALFAAGLLVGQLPSGVRAVRGAARDRYRLRAHLANIAAQSAAVAVRLSLMTALVLRSQFLVNRLGPGPEYATIQAGLAVVARTLGMRRVAERILGRVAAAVPPDDARLAAHVEYMHGVVRDAAPPVGPRSGEYMRRALASHGRLLDLGEYLTGIGVLGQIQLIRGYVDDAAQWHQLGLSRAPAAGELLGSLFATLAPQIAALAGRPAEAAAQLQQIRDFLATTPENRGQRISVAVAAVHLAVEQGATGPEFDEAIAEFAALRVRPAMVWSFQRAFWIHQAFGRLAQAAAAPADERPTRLKTARRAVVALRRAADGPVLRAYHGTARASLRQLRGDHAGALRELARLQIWAGELNLPLLGFEMARVRARAYRALGHSTEADQAAGVALTLATEHGWHARARWIRSEYGLRTTSHSPSSTTVGGDIHRRRLEALQQVSLAAATVLEPDQLTRVTLDEIVRIFGAERAFLFLRGDFLHDAGAGDDEALLPYVGRDAAGTDIDRPTGYGSTLVDRVGAGGEPIVVTGSEEGAALGSRSTLVHNLRSIMVAPLNLKGRPLGVIYLDSRAAKGIFTTDDIDILTALTNHVALSLETARTAQLELAVRAAQRERDLAETLRQAMTDLAANLEPGAVYRCLTATVARVLPVDTVILLYRGDDGDLTVVARSDTDAGPDGVPVEVDHTLADLLAATAPRHGTRDRQPPPLPGLLGTATGAWLAVPLVARDGHRGLVIAATTAERTFTDAETQIAAALISQGLVAIDNALLFQQIQDLAARDGLTNLFNRRHFFEIGRRHLGAAPPAERPVATIMVDIDHFKRVNDTYGHAVGDEVIREVAGRLSACLRASDLICRYGGEEFAVLLPDTAWSDAYRVAERLHATVAGQPVTTEAGNLAVTVSVGVAAPPELDGDLAAMLNQADDALYQAKRAGRNRVVAVQG